MKRYLEPLLVVITSTVPTGNWNRGMDGISRFTRAISASELAM
jgi:hypothetical protein